MAKNKYNFIEVSKPKEKYTEQDWNLREIEYRDVLNSINLPYEPTQVDLMNFNAILDQVHTQAKYEYCVYKRLYEKLKRRIKNSETEVYLIIKNSLGNDEKGKPIKPTESEMKARIITFLTNDKNSQTNRSSYNVYELLDMAEHRMVFMEFVMSSIKDKSDKLITDSGALKLDVQLNPVQKAN